MTDLFGNLMEVTIDEKTIQEILKFFGWLIQENKVSKWRERLGLN